MSVTQQPVQMWVGLFWFWFEYFFCVEFAYMGKSKLAEASNISCRHCDTGTKLLQVIIWIVLGSVETAGEIAKVHILHYVNTYSVRPSLWIFLNIIPWEMRHWISKQLGEELKMSFVTFMGVFIWTTQIPVAETNASHFPKSTWTWLFFSCWARK